MPHWLADALTMEGSEIANSTLIPKRGRIGNDFVQSLGK